MSTENMADVVAYTFKHPREQTFYRILAALMSFTATGNQTHWGYGPFNKMISINRYLLFFLSPTLLCSQIVYLCVYFNELNFSTLGIIFSILPVSCIVNINVWSSKRESYIKVMKDFMEKIHLYNYKDQHDFAKIKLYNADRYTRWTTYFLFVFLMLDWAAWICITGYNNIKNREAIRNETMRLQTVVYLMMPFDYQYNYNNWMLIHTFNIYTAGSGCIIIVLFNSINYAFIFHLIGHIQLLKYKIETEFTGEHLDIDVKKKLVGVIKYHAFVANTFKDVESAFGLNVAANYLYNLIADSLSMYQMMIGDKGNLMMYGLMIVVYMGGLILMSFVLEEIRRQSDGLSGLVYAMPWEKMSVTNQKMVIMILARMQPPLAFNAAGGLIAGVRPMISIIKSTFSYYIMLKSNM